MNEVVDVARLMRLRDHFSRAGDWNMVRELDVTLASAGVHVIAESVPDAFPEGERAINPVQPVKRGPGRPRKHPIEGAS